MLRAAGFALKRSRRLAPIFGYTREDAESDALWGAWNASGLAHNDENHLVSMMVNSGYRKILDSRVAQYRINSHGSLGMDGPEDHVHEVAGTEDPGSSFFAKEIAVFIDSLPEPLPTIAGMLLEGYSPNEIGAVLGVSGMRIHQRRAVLRKNVQQFA